MSDKNRSGNVRAVTASQRNATAGRLLKASKQRQSAIAKVDSALDRTFVAISKDAAFQRTALRDVYNALRVVRRSAARVRIATLNNLYVAVTHGIPNQRLAAQFEDLALTHAKTAMLMVATRGTLAAEGDESITASELIAIDDNGVVADCPEDNLSQAGMNKRASRFSAIAQMAVAQETDLESDEVAALTDAAAGLNEAVSAAVADITTPGDDLSDVTLPGAKGNRKADITTPGDEEAEKVRTNARDPNTPLDTPATAGKSKKGGESTDAAGYDLSDRDAARANQARRKQADADDSLPKEPGTTEQNVDTHFSGNPNDPESGEDNPGMGDASKGERPKFDAKSNRRRKADADDSLPKDPGTTDENVDTDFSGDPNDPEAGDDNPSMGDASKGERPAFDAKSNRRKKADVWTQDENIPQDRPSASLVAGDDDDGDSKPPADDKGGSKPPAPKAPAAPAPAPAAPKAPAAPAAPAPAPGAPAPGAVPGMDDLMGGAPMVDPLMDPSMMGMDPSMMDPSMMDPSMMGGNPFGLQGQNSMDQILADEILGGQGDMLPAPDAGDGVDPALVPSGQEVAGGAPMPAPMAAARANQRATKLASATPDRSAVAAQSYETLLRQMFNQDLLA